MSDKLTQDLIKELQWQEDFPNTLALESTMRALGTVLAQITYIKLEKLFSLRTAYEKLLEVPPFEDKSDSYYGAGQEILQNIETLKDILQVGCIAAKVVNELVSVDNIDDFGAFKEPLLELAVDNLGYQIGVHLPELRGSWQETKDSIGDAYETEGHRCSTMIFLQYFEKVPAECLQGLFFDVLLDKPAYRPEGVDWEDPRVCALLERVREARHKKGK